MGFQVFGHVFLKVSVVERKLCAIQDICTWYIMYIKIVKKAYPLTLTLTVDGETIA